ncbi:MAG: DUF1003 domain-containing protein [Candidatus Diapherotrites archaeon]|nr:DUF1003 domain-containing protein [Candidatus Diapherotrites archaeon]
MAAATPPAKTKIIDVTPHDPTAKTKIEVDAMHKTVYVTEYHPFHKRTRGEKIADLVAEVGGSWSFILLFFFYLSVWVGLNLWLVGTAGAFDPYPFILLNLTLSCLAAIQAPVILMSQNRSAKRDRKKEEHDHLINKKAEHEIADMQKDLEEIKGMIRKLSKK